MPLPVKKLLILDLNGLLLHRHPPGDPRRHREFVTRQHCRDFLDMCFERFDVGVWSCCTREHMEMDLFERCVNMALGGRS